MNSNLLFLFDPTKYEKRKAPSQKEFVQSNEDILLATKDIIYSAHEKLHTKIFSLFKPGEMDKNQAATSMISFIRQGFIRQFPTYCRRATKSRFRLITPSDEYIYIKKLNHQKLPQNIPTISNNLILFQLTTNSKDRCPNIFFGYTVKDDYSKITGIYAVCIVGKKIVWIEDIMLLGNNNAAVIVSIKPKSGGPKLKEGTLRIKRNKKQNE